MVDTDWMMVVVSYGWTVPTSDFPDKPLKLSLVWLSSRLGLAGCVLIGMGSRNQELPQNDWTS